EDVALTLGCYSDRDAHEVGGKRRPGRVVDLGDSVVEVGPDDHLLVGGHEDAAVADLDPDPELLEDHEDHAKIVGACVFDGDLTAGTCCEPDVAAHLEVVRADLVHGAVQSAGAVDHHSVGAHALDVGAHT